VDRKALEGWSGAGAGARAEESSDAGRRIIPCSVDGSREKASFKQLRDAGDPVEVAAAYDSRAPTRSAS